MARALLLAAAVMLAHFGYKLGVLLARDSEWQRASDWFYALRGVLGVVLALALRKTFPPGPAAAIGAFACWLCIWMEGQTAVCGFVWMGVSDHPQIPLFSGLCVVEFGQRVYLGVLAALVATLSTWGTRWTKTK